MSLNRLMLRAFTLNALSPQEGDPDLITMAGDCVFDSALDPRQFDQSKNELPCILVYTDDDGSALLNRADNSGPLQRSVELRVELLIGTFDEMVEDGKTFRTLAVPVTDAELEAKLDIFEQQVRWALLRHVRPASQAFQRFVVRINTIMSHVSRDESGSNKLAMRRLTFNCTINDDCPPVWGFKGTTQDTPNMYVKPALLTEENFAPLPEWLRPMLVTLQQAPSMRAALEVLAGTGRASISLPLFKRLGVNVDAVWPAAESLLARLKKTRGPDGRLEYMSVWEIIK